MSLWEILLNNVWLCTWCFGFISHTFVTNLCSFTYCFSDPLHEPLVVNRKPKLAKEVLECTQMARRERKKGNRKQRTSEREKNLALNEVLREVHNAVCTALKDFSSVGVFLYGPQQMHVQGWAGGGLRGGCLGYEASPAGITVQTTAALQAALCNRRNIWKRCLAALWAWITFLAFQRCLMRLLYFESSTNHVLGV